MFNGIKSHVTPFLLNLKGKQKCSFSWPNWLRKCCEGQGTEDHGKINNSWCPQRHNAIVFQWILHALSVWNRNDVAISRDKDILALLCRIYKSKKDMLNYYR